MGSAPNDARESLHMFAQAQLVIPQREQQREDVRVLLALRIDQPQKGEFLLDGVLDRLDPLGVILLLRGWILIREADEQCGREWT